METDKVDIGLTVDSQRYLKEIEERGWFANAQDIARFALAYAVNANAPTGNVKQAETRWSAGNFDNTGELRAVLAALYPDSETPVRLMEYLVNEGLRMLHSHLASGNAGPAELME